MPHPVEYKFILNSISRTRDTANTVTVEPGLGANPSSYPILGIQLILLTDYSQTPFHKSRHVSKFSPTPL